MIFHVQVEGGSEDGWKDQWWIPITWATRLVNAHSSHKGVQVKDHKELIGKALGRFQQKLEDVSLYHEENLPLIYGQVSHPRGFSMFADCRLVPGRGGDGVLLAPARGRGQSGTYKDGTERHLVLGSHC